MQSSVTVCPFLLAFSVGAHIVDNFEECEQYFYEGHVPQWPESDNHVHICQFFKNGYRFATLYDTSNRIPVYSAYKIEDSEKISRPRWMVEPQLVNQNFEKDMMTEDSLIYKHPKLNLNEIGQRQALDEDYKNIPTGYSRGHLNPSSHHAGDAAKATYTLTNIVPQKQKLNEKEWSLYEGKLKGFVQNNQNQVFVLVGAIPSSENWINRNNERRVNIPDYMWVAYCYYDNISKSFRSGGATAKNTENMINERSLRDLQQFLQNHVQQQGDLFHSDCYVEQNAGAAAGASAAAGNPCII